MGDASVSYVAPGLTDYLIAIPHGLRPFGFAQGRQWAAFRRRFAAFSAVLLSLYLFNLFTH